MRRPAGARWDTETVVATVVGRLRAVTSEQVIVTVIAAPFMAGLLWHRGEAVWWLLHAGWRCARTGLGC
jgi:hypothetical protein